MFLTFFPVKCQFFILFDIILLLSKVSINLRLDKNTVLPLNVSLTIWTENMDYGLPGSSVPGILQARILAWVAISFSRRSSPPRGWTHVSCIAGRFFTDWATREILPVHFSSLTQSCLTLCNCIDCSTPGFFIHHQLPELTQTHVHWVSDAVQPSHPNASCFSKNRKLKVKMKMSCWCFIQ